MHMLHSAPDWNNNKSREHKGKESKRKLAQLFFDLYSPVLITLLKFPDLFVSVSICILISTASLSARLPHFLLYLSLISLAVFMRAREEETCKYSCEKEICILMIN